MLSSVILYDIRACGQRNTIHGFTIRGSTLRSKSLIGSKVRFYLSVQNKLVGQMKSWKCCTSEFDVSFLYGSTLTVQLTLQLPVQSVPITTKAMSSNPVHGEMYSI